MILGLEQTLFIAQHVKCLFVFEIFSYMEINQHPTQASTTLGNMEVEKYT